MRLGYACINTVLRDRKIFCSRSCVIKTVLDKTPADAALELKRLAIANIRDLQKILEWNEQHGIRLFRLTSNLFPHMGNHLLPPEYTKDPYFHGDMRFASSLLHSVGEYARRMRHRLTFHMNPYVQLGSPRQDILERSIFDITNYAKVLRYLGSNDGCIVLHGGGVYQTPHETKLEAKQKTLARWLKAYRMLPPWVRQFIVLENDERHYGVQDLLGFCKTNSIPLCLDVFHNDISEDTVKITHQIIQQVLSTWPPGVVPKFHLSDQQKGGRFGTHADMVKEIPPLFCMWAKHVDLMIEAKNKEQAVLKLLKKHFRKHQKGVRLEWKLNC